MHLKTLLAGLSLRSATADMETEITRISYDSRTTAPGDVFVAMTGFATDGHAYIGKAVAAGAAAVVCERPPEDSSVPYVLVENSRRALAVMAANYYGHPADSMTMVAVTGTNGKTTTTYLLKAILEQELGAKVGLIGTNQDLIGDEVVPTERTTPESLELQELFARMRSAGCTHVVMEASSHALALDRVYGIHYAVGIFTNLTQDHLDFHKTMEAYCDAKAILFQNCDVGVCNADDPWTERLLQNAACRQYFYAEHAAADLRAEHITLAADHIAFDAVTKDSRTHIKVGIPGGFMVYNTLDVLGAALALGVPLEKSARVLAAVPHVKGRVEVVPTPGKDYTVLIDYSHTPDSLENILRTVKGFAKGRTVALFGCGGGGVPGADAVRGPADKRPVYPLPEHELYHQLDRVSDLRGLRHCGLRQRCESDRRHRRAGCQRHLCGDGVLHRSRRPLEHLRHPGSVPGGYGGRAGGLLRL